MKKQHLYFLLTLILATSFFSCASFSNKTFRNQVQNLDEEDISKLEGNFTLNPIVKYKDKFPEEIKTESSIPDSLIRNNAYEFMAPPHSRKNKRYLRSENGNRSITLKFQNPNLLSIKVCENSSVIKDTVLSGKYKKGMFYLDNSFLECNGIPYLFGGCRNNKRRIGLNKNGNLLVNEAADDNGAILFLFWGGTSYNLTYEYPRLEMKTK